MKRIDLHIHTTMSDGAFTPKEVIDEAYKNGVSVMAIADHDTIESYTDELFDYANIPDYMKTPKKSSYKDRDKDDHFDISL